MDASVLRAWWAHRQGLDGSLQGRSPAEVLARTGWARSVGGVGPYLGIHARCGASREAIAEAGRFVRDELGDARAFSLDGPKSRQGRLDALRRM
jgi:hypothetical protein